MIFSSESSVRCVCVCVCVRARARFIIDLYKAERSSWRAGKRSRQVVEEAAVAADAAELQKERMHNRLTHELAHRGPLSLSLSLSLSLPVCLSVSLPAL